LNDIGTDWLRSTDPDPNIRRASPGAAEALDSGAGVGQVRHFHLRRSHGVDVASIQTKYVPAARYSTVAKRDHSVLYFFLLLSSASITLPERPAVPPVMP